MDLEISTHECLVKSSKVFIWKIINFHLFKYDKSFSIVSPLISIEVYDRKKKSVTETYFRIVFYPGGNSRTNNGFASVCLVPDKNYKTIARCKCTIGILGVSGAVFYSNEEDIEFIYNGFSFGIDNFVETHKFQSTDIQLPNNALHLQCQFTCTCNLSSESITGQKVLLETIIGFDRKNFCFCVKDLQKKILGSKRLECPLYSKYLVTLRRRNKTFSIVIIKHYKAKLKLPAVLKVSLVDMNGFELCSKVHKIVFEHYNSHCELYPAVPYSGPMEEATRFMQNNPFISCEYTAMNKTLTQSIEVKSFQPFTDLHSSHFLNLKTGLQEMLLHLYTKKYHSDSKWKFGEARFEAHRFILCCRSPILCGMFESGRSTYVTIPNVQPNIIEMFLKFLYCGVLENLEYESALKLTVIAEIFRIPSLKAKCSSFVKQAESENQKI